MIPDPEADNAFSVEAVKTAIHDLEERVIRDSILDGNRSDGRDSKTLRPIECQINLIAASPRFGRLSTGRNPGAGHGHAGYRSR